MKVGVCTLCLLLGIGGAVGTGTGQEADNGAPAPAGAEELKPPAKRPGLTLVDIPGLCVNLDLKSLEDGNIGLDYELEHTSAILSTKTEEGTATSVLDLQLLSRGYISDDSQNSQNSITAEVRIAGHLPFGLQKDNCGSYLSRRGQVIALLNELEGVDAFEEKEKFNELSEKLKERMNPKTVRFITLDFHAKTETDQSFDDSQYAVGLGATTDLGIITGKDDLANILDYAFSKLRAKTSQHRAQVPRFYFGYDYVTDSDIEARKALTDEDSFSRLAFEAAWMTSILKDIQVRVTWRLYYEIDAPEGIKGADKDFTSLFEVSAGIPIAADQSAMAIVKYTDGELPPTLEDSSNVSVGLRVEF